MFTFTLFLSLWARIMLLFVSPSAPATVKSAESKAISTPTETAIDKRVTWSESRRLTWEDFQGQPDDSNPHHALTAANLAVNAVCKDNRYTYQVNCVFLPQQSWTKNKVSASLLAHEQLHFDLTEVHARQLRHDLQQLDCASLKANLSTVVSEAFKKWKAEQDHFDKVSRHGLNKEEQQFWASSISERLLKLEAYK